MLVLCCFCLRVPRLSSCARSVRPTTSRARVTSGREMKVGPSRIVKPLRRWPIQSIFPAPSPLAGARYGNQRMMSTTIMQLGLPSDTRQTLIRSATHVPCTGPLPVYFQGEPNAASPRPLTLFIIFARQTSPSSRPSSTPA